jgi:hypothetical protein
MGREYRGSITTAARKAKGLVRKKHGLVWFGLLAALGALVLAGCPNPNGGGGPIVPGSDPAHPVTKTIEEQNISETWGAINSAVLSEGKYVILDLSACTADGNAISIDNNSPSENDMSIIKDNRYIKGIILPSSLESIGDMVFYECEYLTGVSIPAGVTSIGRYAFEGCYGLTSITVDGDNDNYSSEDGVLFDKEKSTLIHCPRGKSGEYTIPAGVTTIEYYAFFDCPSLTGVHIPASVAAIESENFMYCLRFTGITVDGGNDTYSSEGGVLFDKEKSVLIKYPGGKGGAYTTIPASVTTISNDAFRVCFNITKVSIPANVTNIGSYAFAYCFALTEVTFEEESAIGEAQFSNNQQPNDDLREKYLAANGGPGTYTRSGEGDNASPYVWTKQGA